MKVIQKEISLDNLVSHLPSVWPAYRNNELYYFDDASISERQNLYVSNYGMIPLDINLSINPEDIDEFEDIQISEECGKNIPFKISFERIAIWYHFFIEYYNLLKHYGHCGRVYTSAIDYYNYESNNKYASEMIYGTDMETYAEIDELFKKRGGIVQIVTYDKTNGSINNDTSVDDAHDEYDIIDTDKTAIVDVKDKGFFKWICENIVPSFIVPYQYREYWKCDMLYYPDVIKWIAWFEKRKKYDKLLINGDGLNGDSWNCASASDCCDCEEYFKRGSATMLSLMRDWGNKVNGNVVLNKEKISSHLECFIPSIYFCLNFSDSIEDSGKKTIFSTEYTTETDYQTCSYGESANTHSGTVSTMDGHAVQLQNGCGYSFNADYMEKYVAVCEKCGYQGTFYDKCPKCGSKDIQINGWDDYTEKYIQEHPSDFCVSSGNLYYAFDSNNAKVYGSRDDDEYWREKLSFSYPLTKIDAVFIEGAVYDVVQSEYGIYDPMNKYIGGKIYAVYRDNNTDTPYTYINGRRIYGILQSSDTSMYFYFPFFYEIGADGKKYFKYPRHLTNESKLMKYIEYNGNIYEVTDGDSTILVGNKAYHHIDGYSTIDDGALLYHTVDGDFFLGSDFAPFSGASLTSDGGNISIPYKGDIDVYNAHEIKGYTYSKLDELRIKETLTDDVGNSIDGVYSLQDTKYFQPPQGAVLDLIYQVGNTANINAFSLTATDEDDVINDANYFIGDIITDMKFYFHTTDNVPYDGIYVSVALQQDNGNSDYQITMHGHCDGKLDLLSGITEYAYTSLAAIQLIEKYKQQYEQENFDKDNEDSMSVSTSSTAVSLNDTLYCDITYHIGATLVRYKGKQYKIALKDKYMYGVKYSETVQLEKEQRQYYLKRMANSGSTLPIESGNTYTHSISYPIYVYTIRQEMMDVTDTLYGNVYELPMANFSVESYGFIKNGDIVQETYDKYIDMTEHNNMEAFPTFAEEYEMGIASIESVDSDIYIDRGINASFEKHLKLGEVTSLEALENYGNGFFKMMTNQ